MPDMLLKFVSKEEHADCFLNGSLFTRPAIYYHDIENNLEPDQRDENEARILTNTFPSITLYKNHNKPVFCATYVSEDSIKDSLIKFSSRMVDEFKAEYVIVIELAPFIHDIQIEAKNIGCEIMHQRVLYENPPSHTDVQFLIDSRPLNLFIKKPEHSYQDEYRFVFCENISQEQKIYCFSKAKVSYARKYRIADLIEIDGVFSIDYTK